MNVHSSKTIVLTQDLSTGNTLTVNNVPFQPHVCILKSISFHDDDDTNNNDTFVISNNINNSDIYTFVPRVFYDSAALPDPLYELTFSSNPNINIYTPNILNQQVIFNVRKVLTTVTGGQLSLVLEFIKYK